MHEKGINKEDEMLMDFFHKGKEAGLLKSRKIGDIASRFDMPKKRAAKCLRRMTERKIGKIAVSFNHRKLKVMTVLLLVKTSRPSYNKQFFDYALKLPFVEQVAQVSGGDATHIITFKIPSFEIFKNTLEKIRREFSEKQEADEVRDWIERTTTRLVYDYILDQSFLYDDPNLDDDKQKETVNIDDKDWLLLALLSDNALTPLNKLGEKLNLAAPAVLRRIRALEKNGVINGYQWEYYWDVIPFELQPLTTYLFITTRGQMRPIRKFVRNLSTLKKIQPVDIYYLFGEMDASVIFRVKSVPEFQRFLSSEIMSSESIARTETYTITRFAYGQVLHDFAKWAKERDAKN